jgi:hypothetical protein
VPVGTRDWRVFAEFALSFDGYALAGDRCAEIANASLEAYLRGEPLPATIFDLRCCVFFEQRRWRHFGEYPDDETWGYLDALLKKIQANLQESAKD